LSRIASHKSKIKKNKYTGFTKGKKLIRKSDLDWFDILSS